MDKIDFKDLASYALMHSRTLVSDIAPGGSMIGKEYTCAGVTGGKGTSCKVNVDTGLWADFASGEKGGDLISLWAASYGVSQLEAAKQLAGHLHYKTASEKVSHPRKVQAVVQSEAKIEIEYDLVEIPETVREPNFFHYTFGAASAHWCYYGLGGERLFWMARYDTKDGKQFIPYSWCQNRGEIVCKAWTNNRPVYGLELLKDNPDTAVLIVEGEKAADAARKFISPAAYTVVSWSGGSKAYNKTDWSTIYGRRVLIWPDNDQKIAKKQIEAEKYGVSIGDLIPIENQPGMEACLGIADILSTHCEVKYFSLHTVPMIGKIDGFDAADALEMAWDWSTFVKTIKPLAIKHEVKLPEPKIEQTSYEWVQGSLFNLYSEARLHMVKDKPHLNMDNVVRMIEYHPNLKGKIWFDDFHLKIFTTWKSKTPLEWSDLDDLMLCAIFQGEFGMHKMTDNVVRAGIRLYANNNRKNEPCDWMNTLKWDGVERIREFFTDALSALPTLYTKSASQNFWLAMVYRAFEPGIKFDHMVILEGVQGAKKSSALAAIAGKWFGESTEHITSKDFAMCLQGKMIIEIAELSAFSSAEVEAVKKVITIQSDRFRPPYGHAIVEFKRTSIFVGTTNRDDYLQDPTGARRFWPMRIGEIDLDYIKNNRDQLFAEAVHKYRERVPYWEMPEEETKRVQEDSRNYDVFEETISTWLSQRGYGVESVKIEDIGSVCGFDHEQLDLKLQRRLGKIMRVLGWESRQVRTSESIVRRWFRSDIKNLN